jgi:uncharacterized membrane protein YqjE
MNSTPSSPGGWFESLRRMGESSVALARGRFELFSIECQEEKLRLFTLLFWSALAVTIGAAGLLVGMAALALWLWEAFGYAGLIGLSVAALATAAGIAWGIRKRILAGPHPFTQTVAEFRKDGACLERKN